MGFDIIGIKPANDTGTGFSRNIHIWTLLWHFICHHCDDILTNLQIEEGFTNDGIRINTQQTIQIVERLDNIINLESSVYTGEAQSLFNEKTRLHLIGARKSSGVDCLPNYQDLKPHLIEFLEFARYSGGFKIC